jgi:hypothetical protein
MFAESGAEASTIVLMRSLDVTGLQCTAQDVCPTMGQ